MASPRLHALILCAGITGLASAQLAPVEPPRAWKMAEGGAAFQASVVSFDGSIVIFRMANGSRAQAPAAKLSKEDQEYLTAWQKKQPVKFVMPESVGVDSAQIKVEVVSEDAASNKYVYRTPHFEFDSQGKLGQALLKDVARNFEATYELVKALPWGIDPKPESGSHFRARLLSDRASYMAAGGPQNSGGVYISRDAVFLVPFDSIGLKTVGKAYAKADDYETHTLVHELTHQMMHAWLSALPQWVVEGTAEYTGNLPLRVGKFRLSAAKNGLKDYVEFLKNNVVGGVPEAYPLEQLFTVSNEGWNEMLASDARAAHRLYFTSYLLVYYFMHLDGKGDAQRFVRFFREVGEVRKQVEDYRNAVVEFKKQPGVEVSPDGSYRWPSTLKHPERPAVLESAETRTEFQRKSLQILLEGRSEADLMKQIRSAYVKLGIRL
jgi:hypothetical protein